MFWSQFVSVCFGMKFFSSFKIHCLQMLQLFQTRDGPFFFIITLVYTCRAFFAVSSKNIYPIYCFGHSSSQSVWQSWRRYLLQLSRRYGVTKMQPSGNLLSFYAVSNVDSGQMHRVYGNQVAPAYSSLYFSFFFLSNFQTLKFLSHFSQELWGLEGWNTRGQWGMYRVHRNHAAALICPLIFSFFFLSNFQTLKIFVGVFSETVRPRRLKLHTNINSG